mmetsp:Transcript_18743/g.52131  ORF Transcript_18743/g.52131 Transcript_18743/m.52131 type:complete len:239 (+) Transcript_18743:261-977(+)
MTVDLAEVGMDEESRMVINSDEFVSLALQQLLYGLLLRWVVPICLDDEVSELVRVQVDGFKHRQLGALHIQGEEVKVLHIRDVGGKDGFQSLALDDDLLNNLVVPPCFFQSVGDEFAESTCGAILNGHPMQVHLLVAHSGMHNGEVILAIFHELLEVERIRLDEHALPVQTHVEHVRIAEVDSIQRAHLNVAAAAETRKSLSKMLVLTELRFAHGAGWFLVAFEDAGVWRGGPRARRR